MENRPSFSTWAARPLRMQSAEGLSVSRPFKTRKLSGPFLPTASSTRLDTYCTEMQYPAARSMFTSFIAAFADEVKLPTQQYQQRSSVIPSRIQSQQGGSAMPSGPHEVPPESADMAYPLLGRCAEKMYLEP